MGRLQKRLVLAWIIGFYEGEGSCGSYIRRYGKYYSYEIQACIFQDDNTICTRIRKFLGYGHVFHYKNHYRWMCQGKYAIKFLNTILPQMQLKYKIKQANKALRLCTQKGAKVAWEI